MVIKMKIDMHCHVSQGSVDSKVSVEEYIEALIEKGIDGMVITDHNTYNGYRYWKNNLKGKKYKNFVVLKGVEYDTRDAGHFLVVMPQEVKMTLLETRGMPLAILIDFVHRHGGVLGPAHPCGEKFLSFTNTKCFYKNPELAKKFDFVEGFNACESELSNDGAINLARTHMKPCVGGSDAHKLNCVGMGFTKFEEPIKTEIDLIHAIRRQNHVLSCGGERYAHTTKDKLGKANTILVHGFWFYNVGGELVSRIRRKAMEAIENPMNPIDPIEIDFLNKKIKKKLKKLKNKK